MSFQVGDQVTVNAKILVRDNEGRATPRELVSEPGVVRKVLGEDVYVETQLGIHYLHESQVTITLD